MALSTDPTTRAAQLSAIKAWIDGDPVLSQLPIATASSYTIKAAGDAIASPEQRAWMKRATISDIEAQADYSVFDNLSQGKRDAWGLVLQYAPRDFTQLVMRKAIADIWTGSTPATNVRNAILAGVTRPITVFETVLGGSSTATQNAVTALVLTWEGTLSIDEIDQARAS